MKQSINLFLKKKQQQPIPVFAQQLRNYAILFIIACVLLSIVSGIVFFIQEGRARELADDVARLQATANANTQIQGSIVFFINKKEQLKTFLKDDADFATYYGLLEEALQKSGANVELIDLTLNVQRDTTFTINFSSFENSEKVLDFVETLDFLSNFENLTLQSFSIRSGVVGQSSVFQLKFTGKFKNLSNEENNN